MLTKYEAREINCRYLESAIEQGWIIETNREERESDRLYLGESPTNYEFTMIIPKVLCPSKNPNEINKWYEKEATPFDHIYIWGKDGLQIATPELKDFNFEELKKRLLMCMECKTVVEKVERVSFAGRYCPICAEKLRPELEKPGWYE